MAHQEAFQLLAGETPVAPHVEGLVELGDLEVELLAGLALGELGELSLNLSHDLHFALKQLRKTAHGVVVLGCQDPAADQWRLRLLDFGDQAGGELLFGSGQNEVQEVLIRHVRAVVVSHEVDQKGSLPVCELLLERARLQVRPEEAVYVPVFEARLAAAALVLIDQSVALQLHLTAFLASNALFHLLEKGPCLEVGQFEHHTSDDLRLHFESTSSGHLPISLPWPGCAGCRSLAE